MWRQGVDQPGERGVDPFQPLQPAAILTRWFSHTSRQQGNMRGVIEAAKPGSDDTRYTLPSVPPPLPPPALVLQANALGVEEQKMGAGVDGEGMMSVSGSPPRRGSRASAGRFQRRLEEASAEVAAESAAAPRIATAAAVGEAQTREACLYSGGGAAAGGLLGGESRGTTRKTWGEHDQLETGDPGDDGPLKQWTPREDGRLKRLVRECVFDFDLVAARFSSAGDADYGGDGGERG